MAQGMAISPFAYLHSSVLHTSPTSGLATYRRNSMRIRTRQVTNTTRIIRGIIMERPPQRIVGLMPIA